uniref:Uncharacterized protein n=1 Tax=Oryza meridionalis TaxID=40149 RepID=A0A0E0EVF6_9ORYZ
MERLDKHIDFMLAQNEQNETLENHTITIIEANPDQALQQNITHEEQEIKDPDQANTKGRKSIRRRRIVENIIEKNKKKKKKLSKGEENSTQKQPNPKRSRGRKQQKNKELESSNTTKRKSS